MMLNIRPNLAVFVERVWKDEPRWGRFKFEGLTIYSFGLFSVLVAYSKRKKK